MLLCDDSAKLNNIIRITTLVDVCMGISAHQLYILKFKYKLQVIITKYYNHSTVFDIIQKFKVL